jgi:hypothetical protein
MRDVWPWLLSLTLIEYLAHSFALRCLCDDAPAYLKELCRPDAGGLRPYFLGCGYLSIGIYWLAFQPSPLFRNYLSAFYSVLKSTSLTSVYWERSQYTS